MKKYPYPLAKKRFDIKTIIITIMAVIIIALLLLLFLPKMTSSLRTEGFKQGIQICQTQIITKIMNDLNTQKFTEIQIGDQKIKLGIVNVQEIPEQEAQEP
ncbi:hypothetical protein JW851_05025 [Candidatus Woesearchaeota archaeon]|nr:hypothetical protein [Candidatus Woesearchaeota archaeon]